MADVQAPASTPATEVAKPADAVTPPTPPVEVKADAPVTPPTEVVPADKPAETKEAAPDTLDLKVPENSLLSKAHVDAISSYAKEKGLSNADAQLLLERDHNSAQAGVEAMLEKGKQQSQQWLKAAQADPDIGGAKFQESVASANLALEKLFPDMEIRKFMDTSGFGNHPSIIKGFAQIGQMLSPAKIQPPGNPPQPPQAPLHQRMYDHPTSPKN